MRRVCLLLLITTSIFASGCEVGRQWFQMDSNSGMPRFGIDLLPRRTTSFRSQTDGDVATMPVKHQQAVELQIPHISDLMSREQEESLQLPRVKAH